MLAGYGELEIDLAALVGQMLGDDEQGIRILYRLRSEAQRLDVADAILANACKALELTGFYSTTYGAIKWCKNMRNTYAHCLWVERDGSLCYFDFETGARSATAEISVKTSPVSVPLLTEQAKYFHYTTECMQHLAHLHAKKTGRTSRLSTVATAPKQQPPPKRHNLED